MGVRSKRMWSAGLALLAACGGAVIVDSSTASAAPAGSSSPTIETISAAKLLGVPKRVTAATAADKTDAKAFGLAQARQGRTVDSAQLWVASGADPVSHGRVSTVWENNYKPQEFRIASAETKTARAGGFGVAVADDRDGSQVTDAAKGFGFSGAVSTTNMYKQNSGCSTAYFDAWYSDTNHSLTTCFEKWAQPGSANWIYNRWALFTEAQQKWYETFWPTIDEFTIRSRPWKGQESKVYQLGQWQPQSGGTSCSDIGNADVSIGPAKITVPIHKCENLQVMPDANQHSMALKWLGSTTDQRYLDFAVALVAKDNKVVPTYADYSWAIVNSCTTIPHCYDDAALLKDAGW
jgi:hypothetical protein